MTAGASTWPRPRSTRASTAFSPSAAGCWSAPHGAAAHEALRLGSLGLRRPRAGGDRPVLRTAGDRGPGPELHRLRPLRARRPAQPALCGPAELRARARAAAVLEVAGQHAVFRGRQRAAVDRAVAGHRRDAAIAAGALQALLP